MSTYVDRVVVGTRSSYGGAHTRLMGSGLGEQARKAREFGWSLTVVAMERFAGYRRGLGNRDFHIAAEVKDLVARKGREARGEVEVLVQSVMRAGSYTRDEAGRAVHAVVSGLQDKVPAELLSKIAEHLTPEEAAALRARLECRAARENAELARKGG